VDIVNESGIIGTLSGIRFKRNGVATNERHNAAIFYDGVDMKFATKPNSTATNVSTDETRLEIGANGAIRMFSQPLIQDALSNNITPILTLDRTGGGSSATAVRYQNSTSHINAGIGADDQFGISALNSNLGLQDVFQLDGLGNVAIGEGVSAGTGTRMEISIPNTNTSTRFGLRLLSSYAGTSTAYGYYVDLASSTTATRYGFYSTGETRNYLSGDLGIGSTAPSAKLDVVGTTELNGDVVINGTLTIEGPIVSPDPAVTAVTTSNQFIPTPTTRLYKLNSPFGGGNSVIGIGDGTDGQEVILVNTGTNAINIVSAFATIGDANDNLILNSGSSFSLDRDDTIHLIYLSGRNGWVEISRSENAVPQF
jgi:hypothetical protein